ncbi:MAG: cell division protein FtsQ, partial [Candidatus Methylomirabilis sp.]|nr:cell division protein FtsQ [Deltaproteobacteria bacterium]
AAAGTKFGPDLEELHVDARGGMELVLAGSAMRVRVGAAAGPEQFERLARVLADLERRGERALRVDLDHREAAVVTLAGAAAGNRDSAPRSARTAGADVAAERRG